MLLAKKEKRLEMCNFPAKCFYICKEVMHANLDPKPFLISQKQLDQL